MAIDFDALPPELAALARERFGGNIIWNNPSNISHESSGHVGTKADTSSKPKRAKPYAPYRSKLEWRFAENLKWRKAWSKILDWGYEPRKFDLAGRCTFAPDFWVKVTPHQREVFVETKGPHAWEDSIIKLKICAAQHPEYRWLLVTAGKGHLWIAREVDDKGIGTSPVEVEWI